MMLGAKVHFVCRAPEHAQAGRDPEGGVLTIEDGRWAVCPWGKTQLHLWTAVEPLDVETARRTQVLVSEGAGPR